MKTESDRIFSSIEDIIYRIRTIKDNQSYTPQMKRERLRIWSEELKLRSSQFERTVAGKL